MKIGFIGGGNMAEALIKGITSRGTRGIMVSDPKEDRRRYLGDAYGVVTTPSNREVALACDIIILAVKPQNIDDVTSEISGAVTGEKTVVSVAAGITLSRLSSRLKAGKLIRAMPNTPALVQKGTTVLSLCECSSDSGTMAVRDIFMSVGEVMTLPEKYMDAVTAVSGSGPAFLAYFIECMIEAGEKLGLAAGDARILAVQTAVGTAHLLDSGMSPSRLREMVTSPGGTTAAGLKALDNKGFRDAIAAALEAAMARSRELGASRHA